MVVNFFIGFYLLEEGRDPDLDDELERVDELDLEDELGREYELFDLEDELGREYELFDRVDELGRVYVFDRDEISLEELVFARTPLSTGLLNSRVEFTALLLLGL